MTEKQFTVTNISENGMKGLFKLGNDTLSIYDVARLINELLEENEQLKQDKFICLDCKYSGYAEIGCLCEKKDHWSGYKTECEDYEEFE
jgi:hypothetical protein